MDLNDFSVCMLEQMEVVMASGGRKPAAVIMSSSSMYLSDSIAADSRMYRTFSFLDPERAQRDERRLRGFPRACLAFVIVLFIFAIAAAGATIYICSRTKGRFTRYLVIRTAFLRPASMPEFQVPRQELYSKGTTV